MPNGYQPPRRLRVFAFDPWTAIRPGNRQIREITLSIPSELDPIDPSGSFAGGWERAWQYQKWS